MRARPALRATRLASCRNGASRPALHAPASKRKKAGSTGLGRGTCGASFFVRSNFIGLNRVHAGEIILERGDADGGHSFLPRFSVRLRSCFQMGGGSVAVRKGHAPCPLALLPCDYLSGAKLHAQPDSRSKRRNCSLQFRCPLGFRGRRMDDAKVQELLRVLHNPRRSFSPGLSCRCRNRVEMGKKIKQGAPSSVRKKGVSCFRADIAPPYPSECVIAIIVSRPMMNENVATRSLPSPWLSGMSSL